MKFIFWGPFLAALLVVIPASAIADELPPFPDFTFKMGKPPKPGTRRLITVQIDPEEAAQPAETSVADQSETIGTSVSSYTWFWSTVPADLSTAPELRLATAFKALTDSPNGGRVVSPRLQTLQTIASREGVNILSATIGTDISPALVLAVIAVESSGQVAAESSKGAQGLMQLMPDTAARFGVTDVLSSAENIQGGVAYLDWLFDEFKGDAILALAGYNAGENAVKTHQGVPPFAETRDYIPKVLAAFEVARGLCKTRPELITDACALNLAMN